MADPVVLEPNDIPLAPRVGEKVETEEQNDILIKVDEVSQEAASCEEPQEHVDGLSETTSNPKLENKGGDRGAEVHSVDDQPGTGDQSHSEEENQERSGEESGTGGYSTENEDSDGERHSSDAESVTDYSSSEQEDTDDEEEVIEEEEEAEEEHEKEEGEEEEEGEGGLEEEEEEEVGNTEEGKQENKQKDEKEVYTNEWDDEESRREKEEMIEMRERGDGQEAEEEKSNPTFIPRRDAFWGHDDRWTDTPQDERRKPTNRKLWDRTTDRWQHDMYREEEQGPKTQEELQETERMLARRARRPGRRQYELQDFVRRGERRGRREGRGGRYGDNRQIGDSNEEENRENKENKAPESRLGSDQKRVDEEQRRRRRFDDSLEGGERIRSGFKRLEGRQRRWQNSQEDEEWPSLGYDERRKTDRRRNLGNGANYDGEVQDNSDRYPRLKDTGNGRRDFDRRQRYGDGRRRDDHREGINDHEGSRELRRREGQRGDAREGRGERDREFEEGGKTIDEKKGARQRHQDDRQEKINQESGGFGSPRKDRNTQDTRDRRPRRGDIIPSTEVQVNAIPSTSTHSYSKLRGRGRGRGQTQELKKPRKNAADFTREREEARKKEEQQKKQAEEENFEDAEEEEEDVIVEEEYPEGEDRNENARNDEKEVVEEDLDEVVEEEHVQSESQQNGEEQTKPGQKLADKTLKQTASSTQQNPASSQSLPASKPKRYSSQRQRVTQPMPLPIHQQVVAPIGTMYPDQAFYDQMAYQGIYVPSGTPTTQSMPLMPQHPEVLIQQDMSTTPGEQAEMNAGLAMAASGPQPMGALQHETLMHQQLAALHQGAVTVQQNMAPEGMPPQRVPQHGMSPQQQQQVLAAHLHMQAQQGAPMVPVPHGGVVNHGMNAQSSAGFVSNMNVQHPHYSGAQAFTGQPLMYNNSQFPVMNVGLNPFVSQQMYGLPLQGGGAFYPPSTTLIGQQQQQPLLEQPAHEMQTRRRPTAAITIKSPQERV